MTDLVLSQKRLLIREDLNAPVKDGRVISDARVLAILPTIRLALAADAAVILMSHLGRPNEGESQPEFSLKPIARCLSQHLGRRVRLVEGWDSGLEVSPGEIVLLENVRFNLGEKNNDVSLAKNYARLCDIFVMDAFGSAHRSHASTCGVAEHAAVSCAGPLLISELEALNKALDDPAAPVAAVVGGSKVSSKLQLLENLATKADALIVGGGIVNTFLVATGVPVGRSLLERKLIPTAQRLIKKVNIPLPTDVVVAREISIDSKATTKRVDKVSSEEMILDIGPESVEAMTNLISSMSTIIWNGPLGVFEYDQFGHGTQALSIAIASNKGFSIAGGGDTVSAIEKYGVKNQISYISTGGGAFLEYAEGKELPAVRVIKQRTSDSGSQ